MTGLSYTLDDFTVTVPELSGFNTTGPCTASVLDLDNANCNYRSHQRRAIDSWRCLDTETSKDQREP